MSIPKMQSTQKPFLPRSVFLCMALASGLLISTFTAFAQVPADLWTPEVLQKIKDQSTLKLQLVPRLGYFEVFYNSEVNSANWYEDSGPPDYFQTGVTTGGTIRIHGYLATPAFGGPYPAVVIGHGHGGHGSPELALAVAALGYVALSIDGPGQGQSSGPPDTDQNWISVEPSADYGYLYHYAYAGMRGLTTLQRLSRLFLNPFRIDSNNLGIIGASMGGMWTYYINGVDDRVKGAVAIAVAGDLYPLIFYPGSWLYHGLYYYTRDGLRTGANPLNAVSDVCTDSTLFSFLNHFDPIKYASSQHAPLLTILGTHDQFFSTPAINVTYNHTASAGTNPRFISRIQFSPNGEHTVINQNDLLSSVNSALQNIDAWFRYSFKNGPAPPETPAVTMNVSTGEMNFAVHVTGGTLHNVRLFVASQINDLPPQPNDFTSILLNPMGGDVFEGSIPIGTSPPCGPPLMPNNILYFAQVMDATGFTISSKMYYSGNEMAFCSGFFPVLNHFPGDSFPVQPAPAPNCSCVQ